MLTKLSIQAINWYQSRGGGKRYLVSCNFTPSCSQYAREAMQVYGFFSAMPMIWRRLRRCNDRSMLHPIADPLPAKNKENNDEC